jgi:hypothetical protein
MAIGIVDRLEVVDVEHDQPDRVVVAADLLDLRGEELLKAPMVGQTGQLVCHAGPLGGPTPRASVSASPRARAGSLG